MQLQLGRAVSIVMQTLPYIAYRAVVYGVICACVAVFLLILALIGKVFGGGAAFVLFMIAAAGGFFAWGWLREYVLYLMQAGHIAVITEIVETGKPPEGSQTAWAKERVITISSRSAC